MKRLILAMVIALTLGSCATKNKALDPQEKALKQQEKELQARVDSARAEAAMTALTERNFMVLIERVSFNHGGSYTVQSNINYIYMTGDKGSVQIASPVASPGPNGIGGLTFSGGVRNFKLSKDKKGNATVTYMVAGYGTSANITIRLNKGQTQAHLNIDSNVASFGMRADGTLQPYDDLQIVKGYPD